MSTSRRATSRKFKDVCWFRRCAISVTPQLMPPAHPWAIPFWGVGRKTPTRRGATLVAPATGVAAAAGPDPPHPAHHDGVSPVTSCRRGVAPSHAAWALQPLDKTARRKNATGWHRFCLLTSVDSAAGTTARGDGGGAAQETLGGGNLSGAAYRATQSSSWHMGEAKSQMFEPCLRSPRGDLVCSQVS